MSRPRLREGDARAEPRNGCPVALAIFEHERTLLLRALRELVEREGPSHAATEVAQMLETAPPADVLRELELEGAALRSD